MRNEVLLIGRLGQDPEIRVAGNGTKVANMSIATTSYVNREEKTEWHRVIAFKDAAEYAERNLRKGDLVVVNGRIQSRKWTDKDGHERLSFEIPAARVQLIPTGNTSAGRGTDEQPGEFEAPF